jgi:hypothetical protein
VLRPLELRVVASVSRRWTSRTSFWKVVNWDAVAKRFAEAQARK